MGSFLTRVVFGIGVAVAVSILLGSNASHAQSGRGTTTPASATTREEARKLVDEGIAAQNAKDYDKAIALFLKAFSLDPHPILLFNVAQAHRLAGCPARAVAFYERYLMLEPRGTQSGTARENLAESRGKPDGSSCAKTLTAGDPSGSPASSTADVKGRLKLRSVPDGVTVMLDGEKIGVTPIDRELANGTHTIVLVDGGMLVGDRKVEISAGQVSEVTMSVERPDRDSRQRRPSRVAPVLVWIGGGLALATSGYLFYLGEQGGPNHPEDRYNYRGATPAGFAFMGAGAAAIGVGVWLWVRGSHESAPVAAISADGGYVGWQGRF